MSPREICLLNDSSYPFRMKDKVTKCRKKLEGLISSENNWLIVFKHRFEMIPRAKVMTNPFLAESTP